MLTILNFKTQLKSFKLPYKKGITKFYAFTFDIEASINNNNKLKMISINENDFWKYKITTKYNYSSMNIPYVVEIRNPVKPKKIKIDI
jgi:hypothetical protein